LTQAQETYYLFLRILWGLKDGDEIPTLPPSDVIAEFNRRYDDNSTRAEPAAANISLSQKEFFDSIPATRGEGGATSSQIFNNMLKLSDTFYDDLKDACAEEGIAAFRPDFRQSHDSNYNRACYKIAEKLFIQQAETNAFKHMHVNLSGLKNKRFLRKTYNHFVFHVMRGNWKRELVSPGAHLATKKTKVEDRRRQRLAEDRWNYSIAMKAPRRQERMVMDPLAHSDDESALSTKKVHLVRAKPLRSAKVTRWLERLDNDMARTKAMTQRRQPSTIPKIECMRSNTAPPTKTHRLPMKHLVPIDWFEPEEFNSLPVAVRRRWTESPHVAFPLDENLMYQVPPHESMTMKEGPFMEKYGNEVLKLYKLPQPGENDSDSEDPDAWTEDEKDDGDDTSQGEDAIDLNL
ncbi:hypothetical protein EXIGLDRAFT_625450, partial [Exidia glandulosa HHB12029]